MRIFLQGERNIGKSTVIRKTLDLLQAEKPLVFGGFYTWNGGSEDPHVYIKSANNEFDENTYTVADFDFSKGGANCHIHVFENEGVRFLRDTLGADLVIMDELGYMESSAEEFKRAVFEVIESNVPVFGVLRLGDVPWHDEIKRKESVTLVDVNEENRDDLPKILFKLFSTKLT